MGMLCVYVCVIVLHGYIVCLCEGRGGGGCVGVCGVLVRV